MTTIDFRTLPLNIPSLCIPRVFNNISEERIRSILNELKLGDIERIDIVSKAGPKNTNSQPNNNNNNIANEKFNMVFIHFSQWYLEGNSLIARERLLAGKEIKILYDDPWFWKISAYKMPIKIAPYKNKTFTNHGLIKMQLDSDEEKNPKINISHSTTNHSTLNHSTTNHSTTNHSTLNQNPNTNYTNKAKFQNRHHNKIRRDHNIIAKSDEFGRDMPRIERSQIQLDVKEEINDVKIEIHEIYEDLIDIPEFNDIIHTLTPNNSPPHSNRVDPDDIEIKPVALDYGNLPMPPKRKARASKKNENLIKLCIEEE